MPLGVGLDVVNSAAWRSMAHPRLLSLAAAAASNGRAVVVVSPFTAYRQSYESFTRDSSGLGMRWCWVVLDAPGRVCEARLDRRGWAMDHAKLADLQAYDRRCEELEVPLAP